MFHVESMLSARLFISPRLSKGKIYFLSNMAGQLSLFVMEKSGSVPQPLLPPDIALHNPHLIDGLPFEVFSDLGKILVMVDNDGDEVYRPMTIPMEGGYPQPISEFFNKYRSHLVHCFPEDHYAYFNCENLESATQSCVRLNLETGHVETLAVSEWGAIPVATRSDHKQLILLDGYTVGDEILYRYEKSEKIVLLGEPLESRRPEQAIKLTGIVDVAYTPTEQALLILSALFADTYSPGILSLSGDKTIEPVTVNGIRHQGVGEMVSCSRLLENLYALEYNIDGVSWLYTAHFDITTRSLTIEKVIYGEGATSNGVLFSWTFDKESHTFALSHSTATSPTQIFTIDALNSTVKAVQHTHEKVLGIPDGLLSSGEDCSYISFDGLRISARLYLPADSLGFKGPRPIVYYVHGGPQGQERPDFAWFSMPLIQFLTLNGFAVFVPNARGSTGYGLSYTKHVDRDWGGKDRIDHLYALKHLAKDPRVDVNRAGVVGRSYGGYMTLTLAARHPDRWKAAVDMFGPFNLLSFSERIPETWKPYFKIALGDPETDRAFLVERSPNTHIEKITCPMLVIQGKNDPRVVEKESSDLVAYLKSIGKDVDYLLFEDEGHDVLKYANRVRCYNAIVDFFTKCLKP
jgi:pimeloyl-ACP methyl ester carboxylesterase